MTAIGIYGSAGRMGRAIAGLLAERGVSLAGGIGSQGDPLLLARAADVLVDFSTPAALVAHLDAARTTGDLDAQTEALLALLDAGTVAHQVIDLRRGLEMQGDAWESVARKLCGH